MSDSMRRPAQPSDTRVAGRTPGGDLILHVPADAAGAVLALLDGPPVICSADLGGAL